MSNKWEREIEELLREKFPDEEPQRRAPRPPVRRSEQRPPRRPRRPWWQWLQGLSPERLMLYGLGLALAAYFLRPFLGFLTLTLALLSVACIAGAIVISVLKRESPYTERRWRGQVIELPTRRGPLSLTWRRWRNRLRRWLNRLR